MKGAIFMGRYLNPGNRAFQKSIRSEIYVDKTELIAYTNKVLETEQCYVCVSRPRRFGKSMAAKMLAAYYSRGCQSEELFQNLKIIENPSFPEHLNQYDVIFLNMQQFLSTAGSGERLIEYIQTELLKELREEYPAYITSEEQQLVAALEELSAQTQRGIVFIIDEWDCIFREKTKDLQVQTAYLDFLRNLLKDRDYVSLAYMTGILPIKKYGTHSALNMFNEYSMTDPGPLAEYVGFTEDEVRELCQRYAMDFDEVKRWYDGYCLDDLHIYSPKSVVEAMRNRKLNSYWTQTETYEALRIYLDMNFDGLKDDIILMLGGNYCGVNPTTFSNDMTTFWRKDDVLTLLIHLGYLAYDETSQSVCIPNEEIRGEFMNAIEVSKWQEVIKSVQASKALLEATLQQDTAAVAEGIDTVHMETASILSYNNENALSCVISLAYYSARNDYILIRELPAGKGFADMVFVPRKHAADKAALIIELKWNQSAQGAIAQIKEKQYVKALDGYHGEILLVGINYDKESKKHQCEIEKTEK